MSRFVTKFLVLLAAVQILGGHWVVLQTVAWTGMLVENAQKAPLVEALVKTFDGSNRCSLCLAVETGRANEKQEPPHLVVKLEAILAPKVEVPPPVETPRRFFSVVQFEREVSSAPITPPPRLA